jgi:hypothetical protein
MVLKGVLICSRVKYYKLKNTLNSAIYGCKLITFLNYCSNIFIENY